MNKEKTDILLLIASAGLAIAGMILLCAGMVDETKGNWSLPSALVCVALSGLFRVIRIFFNKKDT